MSSIGLYLSKKQPLGGYMKRKIVSMMLAIIMMSTYLPYLHDISYGSIYAELGSVTLRDSQGRAKDYYPVGVNIAGQDVFGDTPGFLSDGRTMVPVRVISETLGFDVGWVQESQTVIITSGDRRIELPIGGEYATVNGRRQRLPDGVPAQLMTYVTTQGESVTRTYVPLRFVSEVLGYEVAWNNDTRVAHVNRPKQVLTDIDLFWRTTPQKPYPQIRLKVSGEMDFTSYVVRGLDVGSKDFTVIELQNTEFTAKDFKVPDGIFGLENVTVEQISKTPATTRVIIEQSRRRGHRVRYEAASNELVIEFINTIDEIKVEKIFNTDALVINASDSPNINPVLEGNLLHIDFIDSYLKVADGKRTVKEVNQGRIKKVTYDQYARGLELYGAPTTRVTLEMTEKVTYENFYLDMESGSSQVIVYAADILSDPIRYVKSDRERAFLLVKPSSLENIEEHFIKESRTVQLKIPKEDIYLIDMDLPVQDHIIQGYSVKERENFFEVSIQLDQGTTHTSQIVEGQLMLQFVNEKMKDSVNRGRLIVVDPGHGGRDPGAVGTKITEKEIVLNASLMLQHELERRGFEVYMTRSTDEYVNLSERAHIANAMKADLFVSIHANAHTTSSPNGIEVLYGNESMSSDLGLATLMQRELIRATGARDRGVKHRPRLVVLRETQMPSVLAELGFVSNPREQDLMMQEDYLRKMAVAMADAIEAFLK